MWVLSYEAVLITVPARPLEHPAGATHIQLWSGGVAAGSEQHLPSLADSLQAVRSPGRCERPRCSWEPWAAKVRPRLRGVVVSLQGRLGAAAGPSLPIVVQDLGASWERGPRPRL